MKSGSPAQNLGISPGGAALQAQAGQRAGARAGAKKDRICVSLGKILDIQYGREVHTPTARESYIPVFICSFIFLIWGFAYGLLDTMNAHIKVKMQINATKASLLAGAYYTAYLPAVWLVAGPFIRYYGYRASFLLGLTLFAVGNFGVAGAANAFNFPVMVFGYFLVGLGIGVLERSANPYAMRCGPIGQRVIRINLAQAICATGTIVAPQVAKILLLQNGDSNPNLAVTPADGVPDVTANGMKAIIDLYKAIGASVFAVVCVFGVIFYRTHWVPEIPGDHDRATHSRFRHPAWRSPMLWLGFLGNFFNLGSQVTVAQNVMDWAKEVLGSTLIQGADYLVVAQVLFVLGRLTSAGLVRWTKLRPRQVLLVFVVGCLVSSALASAVPGHGGLACLLMVMFFEGPTFPGILESATSGLEDFASRAEDIMVTSISGGAFLPPMFGLLSDGIGAEKRGTARSFSLVALSFSFVATYAISINVHKPFKHTLDSTAVTGGPRGTGGADEVGPGSDMEAAELQNQIGPARNSTDGPHPPPKVHRIADATA